MTVPNKDKSGNGKDKDIPMMTKEQVEEMLKDIEAKIEAGQKATKDEMALLKFLSDNEPEPKKPVDKPTKPIDEMSREEYGQHLLSQNDAKWEKRIASLEKRIEDNEAGTAMNSMAAEVKDLSSRFKKDFTDSYEKTIEYYKKHPTLSVEEAFHLATGPGVREELTKLKSESEPKPDPLEKLPGTGSGALPKDLMQGVGEEKSVRETAAALYDRMGGIPDPDEPVETGSTESTE